MKKNLYDIFPFTESGEELFETLVEGGLENTGKGFRLERILSFGRTTPENEWYDQQWSEWVIVVKGLAILRYEDGTTITLRPGDHLVIRPHVRHRVHYTSDDCYWIALHFKE